MLLFVIYANFSKICRNYACVCNFKFSVEKYLNNRWITMQQTSKLQTHLSYLYLQTLRVHNSFSEHCTEFKQETSGRTLSWVTELVGNTHALTPVERSSITFCRSQVPETIIRQNICYLRSKKLVAWSINDKLAKNANYASSSFFQNACRWKLCSPNGQCQKKVMPAQSIKT